MRHAGPSGIGRQDVAARSARIVGTSSSLIGEWMLQVSVHPGSDGYRGRILKGKCYLCLRSRSSVHAPIPDSPKCGYYAHPPLARNLNLRSHEGSGGQIVVPPADPTGSARSFARRASRPVPL
jgi:hypothetical protein